MKRIISNPASEIPMKGLETFYGEFKSTRKEELLILQTALVNNDFGILSSMAHKWKGFCEPYGFGELAVMSDELESSAKNQDRVACQHLLDSIEEYLASK